MGSGIMSDTVIHNSINSELHSVIHSCTAHLCTKQNNAARKQATSKLYRYRQNLSPNRFLSPYSYDAVGGRFGDAR